MTKGSEDLVIKWLEENKGKIILPHIGVLTKVERIGKSNSNLKKADVMLNNIAVSLKDVQGSFLYNKAFRSDLLKVLNASDIAWFDQQVRDIHHGKHKRNIGWKDGLKKERFKRLLRILVMDMNLKIGISEYPAVYLLTHPKEVKSIIDICVYDFDEFFEIFAEHWITFAFKRHWPGQGDKSESNRAKRIINDLNSRPWVFDGVSGEPKEWADDAPPPNERKTCFTCSIEIKSPVSKWETLRQFRLSLLNSGFFGVESSNIEKVTHAVLNYFNGKLVYSQEDENWTKVLEIAHQMLSENLLKT
ncbi:MAG: hypothetical protein ACK5CA_12480 [Cyanobacteriota bacterium]|jgi:hypothetical protein